MFEYSSEIRVNLGKHHYFNSSYQYDQDLAGILYLDMLFLKNGTYISRLYAQCSLLRSKVMNAQSHTIFIDFQRTIIRWKNKLETPELLEGVADSSSLEYV